LCSPLASVLLDCDLAGNFKKSKDNGLDKERHGGSFCCGRVEPPLLMPIQ
jgi:hypothetical protein